MQYCAWLTILTGIGKWIFRNFHSILPNNMDLIPCQKAIMKLSTVFIPDIQPEIRELTTGSTLDQLKPLWDGLAPGFQSPYSNWRTRLNFRSPCIQLHLKELIILLVPENSYLANKLSFIQPYILSLWSSKLKDLFSHVIQLTSSTYQPVPEILSVSKLFLPSSRTIFFFSDETWCHLIFLKQCQAAQLGLGRWEFSYKSPASGDTLHGLQVRGGSFPLVWKKAFFGRHGRLRGSQGFRRLKPRFSHPTFQSHSFAIRALD